MAFNTNYQTEEIGFRGIVLGYLKKIMDLNLTLLNTSTNIPSIKTYKESVLGLSDVLIGFFDAKMEKAYEKYEKDYKQMMEETCEDGVVVERNEYAHQSKAIHRNLFRELNRLLKRNDYLKESIYGEEKDEVVEEGE